MRLILPILLLICYISASAQSLKPDLTKMVGQMVMVGFRDTTITDTSHIVNDIKDLNIGGVVLYEYDVPSKSRPRNIISKNQLLKLNQELQSLSTIPLFIGIDEEGGLVSRLKPKYGFPKSVSHQYLGELNNLDSTYFYASIIAKNCKSVGINLNFAPVVDVNTNPNCPVIGKIERSFSNNTTKVTNQAEQYIKAHKKNNILCTIKHFPGHGSAKMDSHKGFTDVSESWRELELEPYKKLLNIDDYPMVMTSHVFNRNIDSNYPATLSKPTINLLRHDLNYDGVIFSDDMMMLAIADNYGFEEAILKALNAGVDILMFSNNINHYNPNIAKQVVETIVNLVKKNEISTTRIEESYNRIIKAKRSLK